jgi:hypothetical protein
MNAGPKSTNNKEGKIKNIVGNNNLSGILAAASSARSFLFVRKLSE